MPIKRSRVKGEPAPKTDEDMEGKKKALTNGKTADKAPPKGPGPPKATAPATSMPVKPNKAFDKKGTGTGRFAHGTNRDEAKNKSHWQSMNKQYIKEQLEMRGHKFTNKQFKGPTGLTKENLLSMPFNMHKNIV